jgi:hypothetical protein
MLPVAVVVHRLPGRMRVRVEERRRDEAYFAQVAQQLRQCPTVVDVSVTPLTGSVLILHDGTDTDVVTGYAKAFDLFEVVLPASGSVGAEPRPDQVIQERLDHVDRWMRRESGDHADLRSLALIGLLGGAVWQMARGRMLPAGATLLWYALVLTRGRQSMATEAVTDAIAIASGRDQGDEGHPREQ